jgi:hypothetical protein
MEPKRRNTYVNSISQNISWFNRIRETNVWAESTPDEQTKWTESERKMHTVRPAGLKPRRSFSYTTITKKICFDCAVALCTMQNALLVISNLTWLVVIYRLNVAIGSLHTHQFQGFDGFRNDLRVIQNRSAKINYSLYLSASYFSFRIFRQDKKIERPNCVSFQCGSEWFLDR